MHTLLKKFPIISEQVEHVELEIILTELEKVIDSNIDGDIVEFGCFTGTTSLFLQRLLITKSAGQRTTKKLWVYDSFDGLPDKTKEDQSPLGVDFRRGELRSTKAEFVQNFRKAQLPLPIITKSWFHEVQDCQLPDKICLAFLDGDYYKSIRSSLDLVLPRMVSGGVIIIDDYDNPALPGAKKATDQVIKTKIITKSSLGIIRL